MNNRALIGICGIFILVSLITLTTEHCDAIEFKEIYRVAVKLESLGKQGGPVEQELRLARGFLKPEKSDLVYRYILKIDQMINEIRSKTIAIYHSILNEDFAGGLKRLWLLKDIRNYASYDSEIATYVDGLNWKMQDKKRMNEDEVNCAMDNLKSRHHQVALFVLGTELKHLVKDDIGLVNDAILNQLREQKLQSKSDNFNSFSLNDVQTNALKEFYSTHRDVELADSYDYLDHVTQPGQLIIGRLFDTCSTVVEIYAEWAKVSARQAACPAEVTIFKTNFMPKETGEAMQKFCFDFTKV